MMQDRFPWLVQPSEEEFNRLWEEGTFVFDTNVLLDLYRRSSSFKEDFFNVLEDLEGRVWLPHRVAEEFMRNRPGPISSQLRNFEEAEEKVDDWWEGLRELSQLRDELESVGDRKGPIEREIDDGLLDGRSDFQEAAEAFKDQVLNSLDELRENLLPSGQRAHPAEDDTLRKLENVFDGKVGDPCSEGRLEDIYEDGKERYDDEIPPGFGDADKDDPSRKFADLVIWKQILGNASDHEKDIVFVTQDTEKEDWWEENSGLTVGPLPHLRKEFHEEVGTLFWMYQGSRFLDRAQEPPLEADVQETSIKEAEQSETDQDDSTEGIPSEWSFLGQLLRAGSKRRQQMDDLSAAEMLKRAAARSESSELERIRERLSYYLDQDEESGFERALRRLNQSEETGLEDALSPAMYRAMYMLRNPEDHLSPPEGESGGQKEDGDESEEG